MEIICSNHTHIIYNKTNMQHALLETNSTRLRQNLGHSSYKDLIFRSEVASSFGYSSIFPKMDIVKKNTRYNLQALQHLSKQVPFFDLIFATSHIGHYFFDICPRPSFPQQHADPVTFLCWRCPEKTIKSGLHQEVQSGHRHKFL